VRAADAIYENTQRMYKEQGVTHVVAFRGMVGTQTPTSQGQFLTQTDTGNALSSWSTLPSIAQVFAAEQGASIGAAVIPVNQIFATPLTGVGALEEYEIVRIGKPLPQVWSSDTSVWDGFRTNSAGDLTVQDASGSWIPAEVGVRRLVERTKGRTFLYAEPISELIGVMDDE